MARDGGAGEPGDGGGRNRAGQARDSDAWLARAMTRALSPAERRMLRLAADLIDQVLDDDGGGDDPVPGDDSASGDDPAPREKPAPGEDVS
ncbi:hypothetical protein ACQPYK_03260 [Streptosporangium sp. CA-135522]|uniref:hypothetical protein n=1 Tax=Streptosporangium sp. CA-135522 TaxID=3240072 RepID=UPI003D921836